MFRAPCIEIVESIMLEKKMNKCQKKKYRKSLRRTPETLSPKDIPFGFRHRDALEYARRKGADISELSNGELKRFIVKKKASATVPKLLSGVLASESSTSER